MGGFGPFGGERRVSDAFSPNLPKGNESVNLDALPANYMRGADPAYGERISDE